MQAAIGLIRANTNNMRSDFESASSSLIEVDPYRRSNRNNTRQANVSSIDYSAGRGSSGVDLRWHTRREFLKLSKEQKDELSGWLKTDEGKKHKKDRMQDNGSKKGEPNKRASNDKAGGNWKKKFKRAIKTDRGLKTIMSIMASEEQNNQALVSALSAATPLPPIPQFQPPPLPPATAISASVTAQPPTATVASLAAAFPEKCEA